MPTMWLRFDDFFYDAMIDSCPSRRLRKWIDIVSEAEGEQVDFAYDMMRVKSASR